MIKLDRDGLSLCKIQGELFEKSITNVSTSSSIFIRRFMNSEIAKAFDSKDFLNDTISVNGIYKELDAQFGESKYGSTKFNSEVLFWIGYIYRYFSYTYDLSSKQVYKIIKPNELNEMYYVYHTFDCANAIERILEEKGICFEEDKLNDKLLSLIRNKAYEKSISFKQHEVNNSLFKANNKPIFLKEAGANIIPNGDKKYEVLPIFYKDNLIGEVIFKKIDETISELIITFKNDKYNNEMELVVINKAINYAKEELGLEMIRLAISKNNDAVLKILEKQGFVKTNQNNNYAYLEKRMVCD